VIAWKGQDFGIGNLYSRIPGLSVLSGGVDAHQRKETKMTARTPKVVVFKGELTKAAVIFVSFLCRAEPPRHSWKQQARASLTRVAAGRGRNVLGHASLTETTIEPSQEEGVGLGSSDR
jgi:hypothetical protein